MRVLIFGASGMVGGGVLRECLRAPDVEQVVSVGRTALAMAHAKLVQSVRPNFAIDPLLSWTMNCAVWMPVFIAWACRHPV